MGTKYKYLETKTEHYSRTRIKIVFYSTFYKQIRTCLKKYLQFWTIHRWGTLSSFHDTS